MSCRAAVLSHLAAAAVAAVVAAAARSGPLFWVDDVAVTGQLAAMAGVSLLSLSSSFTPYRERVECCTADPARPLCPWLAGPTEGDGGLVMRAAARAHHCRTAPAACTPGTPVNCTLANPLFLPDKMVGQVFIV